ncbi:MAG: methyl-accepting chemotaxis protein [Candidatus Metalachnospira sp.]|nr:methyl-accepting chemotaxis protein [Candidatus Metalachnospira sp.]
MKSREKEQKKKIHGEVSMRKQMVMTVAAVFIITMIVTVAAGIFSGMHAINKNVEDDMQSIGAMADVTLSGKISDVKSNVEALANLYNSELEKGNATPITQVQKMLDSYQFMEVATVDKQGNATSTASFLKDNLSSETYIQSALKGETVLTSTVKISDDEVRFYAVAPTNNGCIIATLDGQYFSNIVNGVVVGDTGNVFMLDNEGTIISNKRPQLVTERQNFKDIASTAAAVYTRMVGGEKGIDQYSYETGARICAFGPVTGTDGWSYGVVAPIKEMNTPIIYIIVSLTVCSLVCMIVGLILITRYASSLAKPIQKITQRMSLLAQGDLDTEVEVINRKDEIGTLSRSFYETVETLKSYIFDIANVLHEISQGNLQVTPQANFQGEFIEIRDSLDTILNSLNEIFKDIIDTTEQVSYSTKQFVAGAETLSEGTTEQASSVEELAATISEINTEISNSAHNAEKANQRIQSVGNEAAESNRRMQEMLKAMHEIKDASGQINNIIKTIEDIAFQTNILALNAAVEAARAGTAGKGFAVVADEVRNLAGKSAEASQNTSVLIENALTAVQNGTNIADETAQSLTKVVSGVAEVAKTAADITEASTRQAEAASQINMGIEQISGVVQTNSATAEESAATSQELLQKAEHLAHLVRTFKLHL